MPIKYLDQPNLKSCDKKGMSKCRCKLSYTSNETKTFEKMFINNVLILIKIQKLPTTMQIQVIWQWKYIFLEPDCEIEECIEEKGTIKN
jgi:hypothetical protein